NYSFANESKISEDLSKKLESNEVVDIMVLVKDTVKLTTMVDLSEDEEVINENRQVLLEELQENADNSQEDIIDFLDRGKKAGTVEKYESFYVVNSLNIVCDANIVKELSKLDDVEYIEENLVLKTTSSGVSNTTLAGTWNLINTGVDDVHSQYAIKGTGVIIGILDTGASYKHDDIKDNWYGNKVGVKYAWYDALGESSVPVDESGGGHGTGVTDVAVGKNYGVAPNASWISARAFKDKEAEISYVIRAAEWFLAPGGDTTKVPHIINNSWGGEDGPNIFLDEIINSWIKAGIIPVFASGNSTDGSKTPSSIFYPASNLNVISVGGLNPDNSIYYRSSIGPSKKDPTGKVIKPEITAPGASVIAANNIGSYTLWYGTSIAAPNISGVIALMIEANPDMSFESIKKTLTSTATGLTDSNNTTSPNMVYGYGIVNAKKAVDLALDTKIDRISGSNRYTTSLEISKRFYESSDIVYITNGLVFADGLSMGSLTKNENGPLLLSSKDSISKDLADELIRLNPKKIVIIGGNSAISETVEGELKKYATNVERISGSDRINTSIKIAEKSGSVSKEMFLVNGFIEADSINIVSVSSRDGVPILFTRKDKLPPEVLEFIKGKNVTKINIVGGEGTVSSEVKKELENNGITVERIAGLNRYDTGIKVNQKYHSSSKKIFFTNGINIADALAVGPSAAKIGAQIQIIPTDSIPKIVSDYYSKKTMDEIYILGGTGSVSARNKKNIYSIFN
ncbi:cell wall-binding repeat-containing protein, partial [Peptostreptococcaceae bacterium OttesenSCG-928-C18]|nr:cell wall-binding repeat-containing protein [Peptostreptococcaceae bacterium OttesenSCG-928-C18]